MVVEGEKSGHALAPLDVYEVALTKKAELDPIDAHPHRAVGADPDPDFGPGPEGKCAIEEGMSGHRAQQECLDLGSNKRSPGGEVVGRRSGRCRRHEPVGSIGQKILAIDRHIQKDQPLAMDLLDHDIVDPRHGRTFAIDAGGDGDPMTFLQAPGIDRLHHPLEIVGASLGQKTNGALVKPEDRDVEGKCSMSRGSPRKR